ADAAERVPADERDLGGDDHGRGGQQVDLLARLDHQVAGDVENAQQPVDGHVQAVKVVRPVEGELGVPAAGGALPGGAVVVAVGPDLRGGLDDQLVGVGGDVALGPEQVDRMAQHGDLLAIDHGHAADDDDGGRVGDVGHLDVNVDDRQSGGADLQGSRGRLGVDQDGVELPVEDAQLGVHRDLVDDGDVQVHAQVVAGAVGRVRNGKRVDRNRAED